ncbi:MAG: trypsin-like peptidase domain-containing protein [Vicinamibacterales bacterium]
MNIQRHSLALGSSILLAGFVGGLVLSGRMSWTSPSSAEAVSQQSASQVARPASLPAVLPDLSSVAEAALKVSVNISSTIIIQPPQDPFSQFFYGNRAQQSQSLGSGVVVSPDGYVLTNKHVIGNAGAEIRVTLPDGQERPARLVGLDDLTDLAVVKVDVGQQRLQTLPWGDSTKLRVAEWVLAIGNPFQLSGTVTLGIISTVKRSGEQTGAFQEFIQTDAAINPGNSGGALVNARGELVGINTMIYSETGGYQGIGFAIPSTTARGIMTELIENGSVTWGSIGAVDLVYLDRAMAERYGLNVTGAVVRSLSRNSSAFRAGLQPGDTVLTVNGQKVSSVDQIERIVVREKVGAQVRLEVQKANGRTVALAVPIVARESPAGRTR